MSQHPVGIEKSRSVIIGGDYNVRKGFPELYGYHVTEAGVTVVSTRGYGTLVGA